MCVPFQHCLCSCRYRGSTYRWLLQSHLSGWFWLFFLESLGGGGDLWMVFIIVWMQVEWWGHKEVVRITCCIVWMQVEWWGHKEVVRITCCNRIHLNFLHSRVVDVKTSDWRCTEHSFNVLDVVTSTCNVWQTNYSHALQQLKWTWCHFKDNRYGFMSLEPRWVGNVLIFLRVAAVAVLTSKTIWGLQIYIW